MVIGIVGLLLVAGLLFEGPGLMIASVLMVILAMARSNQAAAREKMERARACY